MVAEIDKPINIENIADTDFDAGINNASKPNPHIDLVSLAGIQEENDNLERDKLLYQLCEEFGLPPTLNQILAELRTELDSVPNLEFDRRRKFLKRLSGYLEGGDVEMQKSIDLLSRYGIEMAEGSSVDSLTIANAVTTMQAIIMHQDINDLAELDLSKAHEFIDEKIKKNPGRGDKYARGLLSLLAASSSQKQDRNRSYVGDQALHRFSSQGTIIISNDQDWRTLAVNKEHFSPDAIYAGDSDQDLINAINFYIDRSKFRNIEDSDTEILDRVAVIQKNIDGMGRPVTSIFSTISDSESDDEESMFTEISDVGGVLESRNICKIDKVSLIRSLLNNRGGIGEEELNSMYDENSRLNDIVKSEIESRKKKYKTQELAISTSQDKVGPGEGSLVYIESLEKPVFLYRQEPQGEVLIVDEISIERSIHNEILVYAGVEGGILVYNINSAQSKVHFYKLGDGVDTNIARKLFLGKGKDGEFVKMDGDVYRITNGAISVVYEEEGLSDLYVDGDLLGTENAEGEIVEIRLKGIGNLNKSGKLALKDKLKAAIFSRDFDKFEDSEGNCYIVSNGTVREVSRDEYGSINLVDQSLEEINSAKIDFPFVDISDVSNLIGAFSNNITLNLENINRNLSSVLNPESNISLRFLGAGKNSIGLLVERNDSQWENVFKGFDVSAYR